MILIFNGVKKEISTKDELINVISGIFIEAQRKGEFTQISIDNEPFYQELSYLKLIPEIKTVEVINIDSQKLILEALVDSLEYVPRLVSGLVELSDMFRQSEPELAFETFMQALEGFEWLSSLLQTLDHNLRPLISDTAVLDTLNEDRNNFSSLLGELLVAWENQDFGLIADLLEYEILSCLENLHGIFNTIMALLSK